MAGSAIPIQSRSPYGLGDFSRQPPSQGYYYHGDHQHQEPYHAAHGNQSQPPYNSEPPYKMKPQVKEDHMITSKELSCWSACSKITSSQSTSVFCLSLDLTSSNKLILSNTAS